jgi:hypothetical protein
VINNNSSGVFSEAQLLETKMLEAKEIKILRERERDGMKVEEQGNLAKIGRSK